MAVTFTPNIGLAKPTEAELALEWTRNTKLNEDNNLLIIDKADVNMTTNTSGSIIAQTTPPSVGAGFCKLEWTEFQGFISGYFIVEFFSPGFAGGSGNYGIALPIVIDSTFHTVGTALNGAVGPNSIIGEAYLFDFSASATCGHAVLDAVTISGVSYVRMISELYTSPAKTSPVVQNGQPFTVADQDRFTGHFFYKKA